MINNLAVAQEASTTFAPITITSLEQLQALISNPPEVDFKPVTIVLKTKVALANMLGALLAYGTANTYAENGLKAVGLGEYYSGNVRGASRTAALEIATASNVVPLPEFNKYLAEVKFKGAKKSRAGAKVFGTSEDLAGGRTYSTTFEPAFDGGVEVATANPVATPVARPIW